MRTLVIDQIVERKNRAVRLQPLPEHAAWRHQVAREGCEVAFFGRDGGLTTLEGSTVAVESGEPWAVDYHLVVDERWRTRRAVVTSRSRLGARTVRLDHDGLGRWLRDGVVDELLDGCLDVDLESSALTNTLPVHRFLLGEPSRQPVAAPAAFVRARDVAVERLEQSYRWSADGSDGPEFEYSAPIFEVHATLAYDRSGLVLDYPGLAVRLGPR